MTWFQDFVDKIDSQVSGLCASDLIEQGQPIPLLVAVCKRLSLDDLAIELMDLLGEESVRSFYVSRMPKDYPLRGHLIGFIMDLVSRHCSLSQHYIRFDKGATICDLAELENSVRTHSVTYRLYFRVSNIDIDEEFALADGVIVRKITAEAIQSNYPVAEHLTPLPPLVVPSWLNHRVEVVIERTSTPADLSRFKIEEREAMVNSIEHAFLLANVPKRHSPFVTHVNLQSPIERYSCFRGVGGFADEPTVLTPGDIQSVRDAYALLKGATEDNVLDTAIDRFILGRKQGMHHPNRVNKPHWDKIVDYVIAMETLFLTAKENPGQELAYRFSLNGAALLRGCTSHDVFQLFDALKSLYNLRSKVVHGVKESETTSAAEKFIRRLNIDRPNYQHALGRLVLVSEQIEAWFTQLLFHIANMPLTDRPYLKSHGWEELLFGKNKGDGVRRRKPEESCE